MLTPTSASSSSQSDEHQKDSAQDVKREATVNDEHVGLRFDQAAAILFPDFSRGQLQKWIKSGELALDGAMAKPKQAVGYGQKLTINAVLEAHNEWQAETLALDVLLEDDDVLVINKPAGLVVHPAAGNPTGTLANAILAHCPENHHLPRAGIVHRLDKDTSGVMMVAKSLRAHHALVDQLQQRNVSRRYRAIACGTMVAGGTIDAPIGRHPQNRLKMAVRPVGDTGAKPAVTHYRIRQRFTHHTELTVNLETGRTHQIRVHLADKGYPLLGDQLYLGSYRRPAGISETHNAVLSHFKRQALHAEQLEFVHPNSRENIQLEASPPQDYLEVLNCLYEIQEMNAD